MLAARCDERCMLMIALAVRSLLPCSRCVSDRSRPAAPPGRVRGEAAQAQAPGTDSQQLLHGRQVPRLLPDVRKREGTGTAGWKRTDGLQRADRRAAAHPLRLSTCCAVLLLCPYRPISPLAPRFAMHSRPAPVAAARYASCSTTVFSHASTVVFCGACSTVLCQPTGTHSAARPHRPSRSQRIDQRGDHTGD